MKTKMDEQLFKTPPRIQGKVGQAEQGQGYDGKWFFEIWMSFIGSDEPRRSMGLFGPWDTEQIALKEMRNAVKLACDKIEQEACGETSGKFYDMKEATLRSWEEN